MLSEEALRDRVNKLNESNTVVSIACTGAGAGVQGLLTKYPGGSKTLLESVFPYDNQALTDYLGEAPEQYASMDTAYRMAARAWRRGKAIVDKTGRTKSANVVGIGLTAVIGTNRILRGEHRVFLCARNDKEFFCVEHIFPKGADGASLMGRDMEAAYCDKLALDICLFMAKIIPTPDVGAPIYERVRYHGPPIRPHDWYRELFVDEAGFLRKLNEINSTKYIIFPGAFDPLHYGHEEVAQAAERLTGKKVVYAIEITHPNKRRLLDEDVKRRVDQFRYIAPVMVTDGLGLYQHKATVYPGFTFLLGDDAMSRITDPQYYEEPIEDILKGFIKLDTKFVVALRRGAFEAHNILRDRIMYVPGHNISSTQLRG